jgi:hypothetical protein
MIIIYFIQLYYLIYIDDKKSLFIFIISLLIINVYSKNLIISVFISFLLLYFLNSLKLLNEIEQEENIKYHYVLDFYVPNIERGILIKDNNIIKEDNNIDEEKNKKMMRIMKETEDKQKWLNINDINNKINKSKLIGE